MPRKSEYASLQFNITGPLATELDKHRKSAIAPGSILKEETDPHVTVFYGLDPNVTTQDVQRAIKGFGSFWYALGDNGRFQLRPGANKGINIGNGYKVGMGSQLRPSRTFTPGEDCAYCGASFERGDDGDCLCCGKPYDEGPLNPVCRGMSGMPGSPNQHPGKQIGGWIDPTAAWPDRTSDNGDSSNPGADYASIGNYAADDTDDDDNTDDDTDSSADDGPCDVLWIGQSVPDRYADRENQGGTDALYGSSDSGFGYGILAALKSSSGATHVEKLHRLCASLPFADKELATRRYVPHLTLAYVNPGAHPEWEKAECPMKGRNVFVDRMVLSRPDNAVKAGILDKEANIWL